MLPSISKKKRSYVSINRPWREPIQGLQSRIVKKQDNPLIYCNEAFTALTGYKFKSIVGKNCRFLQGDDRDQEARYEIRRAIDRGESITTTIRNYTRTGERFWNRLSLSPIKDIDGKITHYVGIQQDISQIIDLQHEQEELLKEKQVLINEIHHRIKNNMAVVSGLLELQKNELGSETARRALTQSQLRLHSMAKIHDQLYKEQHLSDIKVDKYIESLVESIKSSLTDSQIEIRTDLASFALNVNQTLPLGLLLNELVVNAFKHAFPEGEKDAQIDIQIDKEGHSIQVEVSDNGIGLPEHVDPESPDKMGFTVVKQLIKQLDADMQIESDQQGTKIRILFEAEELKGSVSIL